MRTTRRGRWALFLLAVLPAAAPPARADGRGPSAIAWEEGARAPADTWTQEDGCPARTGATESAPMVGPREPAWKFAVAGEIEGEPLVWRSRTFVVERAGAKRVLHVLATATGVERFKQAFDTVVPLAPCVGDGRIVLRTSPRTVQGFSVGEKALVPRWTFSAKSAVGPPTLVRDEVYVVVDGVLTRRTYGAAGVVWPKAPASAAKATPAAPAAKGPAAEFPRPSVRGGSVFLATGRLLLEVDRADGSITRQATLDAEADPRTARVVVGFGDVLVLLGKRTDDGVDTFRFGRPTSGPFEPRRACSLPYGVASLGRDWVGVVAKPGADKAPPHLALALLRGADTDVAEARELAAGSVHAEYLETKVPASTGGDVVMLAGRAFDAESLDVLWPEPLPSVSRTIPLRDHLLVVDGRKSVTAWRRKQPAVVAPPLRLLAFDGATPPAIPAAHAVVDDGRVVAGGFTFDAKAGALRVAGKPGDAGAWPVASVRAFVTDEAPRRLLLASRPDDAASGVLAIARAEAGIAVLALLPDAVASGDAELARRVLTTAAELGAPEADVGRLEKDVAAMEAVGPPADAAKAAAVAERLAAATAGALDAVVAIAGALPADAPIAYATALVRAVVERSPYHGGATDWVRAHLTDGLAPTGGFRDLPDWLAFFELLASNATLRVYPPKTKQTPPDGVRDALASARSTWRDDLVGFQNGPLLVIAPPQQPGTIARCLLLGRVVSDALDQAFAPVGPPRGEDELLVLHLFPSKGEYLAQSRRGDGDGGHEFGGLEHTAGHYSPSANVTRIYFPEGRTVDSVLGTYAHELTHHWVGRRRPARRADEALGDRAGGRGYFVVEGIADFVRGFAFDVATGSATPANPRAEYADVVAGVAAGDAVPWPKILTMAQREAYALPHDVEVKVPLRWRMGTEGRFDKVNLYYAQAASMTAYLFLADGGKYRPALFTYLYDHYAGTGDPDALLRAVGVSADELGARIVAWCRSVVVAPK